MENKIKQGDIVRVKATIDQLNKIGIHYNAEVILAKDHTVIKVVGEYTSISSIKGANFTIRTIWLEKCEE